MAGYQMIPCLFSSSYPSAGRGVFLFHFDRLSCDILGLFWDRGALKAILSLCILSADYVRDFLNKVYIISIIKVLYIRCVKLHLIFSIEHLTYRVYNIQKTGELVLQAERKLLTSTLNLMRIMPP